MGARSAMGWEWDGNGMGMGIKCMGMGVKTWELSPATVFCSYIVAWSKGSNAGGATA